MGEGPLRMLAVHVLLWLLEADRQEGQPQACGEGWVAPGLWGGLGGPWLVGGGGRVACWRPAVLCP